MPITMQMIVSRRDDALTAEVGGEIVLMSGNYDNYYGLDEIGSDIWRRLEKPIPVGELCAALSAEYEGEPRTIENDVVALLEQLLNHRLIDAAD